MNFKRGLRNPYGARKAISKTGLEWSTDAPWRRTLFFKQPITLVHTTSKQAEKPPEDLLKRVAARNIHRNFDVSEKPHQIFWAKALEGLEAVIPINIENSERQEFIQQHFTLPPKTETAMSSITDGTASTSLIAAILHMGGDLVGQQATKKQIEDNPLSTLSFSQPFVQISPITEQDIVTQEKRVLDARKRLQELRNSFFIR